MDKKLHNTESRKRFLRLIYVLKSCSHLNVSYLSKRLKVCNIEDVWL